MTAKTRFFGCFLLSIGLILPGLGRSFDLLVYNVENLFDADGVAVFDDYREFDKEGPVLYSPRKLLTKLENIARVLEAINEGEGPEIVVFNELEFDRTSGPEGSDYELLKLTYAGQSVEALLTSDPTREARDLPVEFLLWKLLQERGMGDYVFAVQSPRRITEEVEAHTNAVFSKFPIEEARSHPTEEARDILEVVVNVEGHRLIVFANHWKSGASRRATETLRVQNARVLRNRLNDIFEEDPYADVIVAGDLNSNYNQNFIHPEEITGIIHVLGSQGDELAIRDPGHPGLYNLWFELPPEERFSEVYRDTYSTLMHILVSRGLYDFQGVQYLDGSFKNLILPGVNARPPGMRPIRWYFLGETGGGYSDHLPIVAEFQAVREGRSGFLELENPSRTPLGSSRRFQVLRDPTEALYPVEELKGLTDSELAERFGDTFQFSGTLISVNPLILETAGRRFGIYAPDPELFQELISQSIGQTLRLKGRLGEHRGQIQFVIDNR